MLGLDTVATLNGMGIAPPLTFPDDLRPVLPVSSEDLDGEDPDEDLDEDFVDNNSLDANPYTIVIQQIYASLTIVAGFYSAYVDELTNEDELLDIGLEASGCLMQLATCKIEVDPTFAPACDASSASGRSSTSNGSTRSKCTHFERGSRCALSCWISCTRTPRV